VTEPRFLRYKNSAIAWYSFGQGAETVLCFHGYGEQGGQFGFLDKYAGNRFRFIAIDLPFHGRTDWKEGLHFSITDLQAIVKEIVQQGGAGEKFRVAGFSLGGRMALHLYTAMPHLVSKIVLLAPDGLKMNFWYWLSTQTKPGNKLFALTMKKPHWFLGLLKGLHRLRLVNASIFKFVHYYIGDKTVREQLYNRWTGLRKIKPDLQQLKRLAVAQHTPVSIVYGKHDRIIGPARGAALAKQLPGLCTVTIIESGHQVLHEKHAAAIISALAD
jgi:pimeloyl-ACP methyl ester carboxylesterase